MNVLQRILLTAAGMLLLASACVPQPLAITREPTTLQLVAADSCSRLSERVVEAYQSTYPWVAVERQIFDTSVAERRLRAGEADIALLAWLDGDTEEPLWSQPFTRDGIAIIANPSTPLAEMGLVFLEQIYRGRVQEWDGTVLTAVSREDGSGTRAAFESAALGGRDVTLTAVVMPSNQAVVEHVTHTPGALGYVSTQQAGMTFEAIRVLPLEGILPTAATITDGRYPLSHPLYVATVGEPTGEAREFAQWLLGPDGQQIVRQ